MRRLLTREELLTLLPHREDAFLVANVVIDTTDPEKPNATGELRICALENVLDGHFPGKPIIRAADLLDALAQLAGALAMSWSGMTCKEYIMQFAGVEKVRWPNPATPSNKVSLAVELTRLPRKGKVPFSGEAYIIVGDDEKVVCSFEGGLGFISPLTPEQAEPAEES